MRMQEAAKMLAGSIVIYVVMAACAARGGVNPGFSDDGGPEGNNSSGGGSSGGGAGGESNADGSGSGSGSDGSSVFDALTNPVPGASADPYQSGSRLKANYYAGADGSKQFMTMHDTQLNVDCAFQGAADGVLRCIPTGQGIFVGYYADSGCTQPIVAQYKGCSPPLYAVVPEGSGCALQRMEHVLSVTGAYSGGGMVYLGSTMCSATPASALTVSYDLYTTGAEVPASTFVQATVQAD